MAFTGLNRELRVVLVGKTGVGKSCLGNSLLQHQGHFHSELSGESITKECSRGTRYLDDGKMIMMVDTPGVFDTAIPNEITKTEIVKCVGLTSPGPHIFIFVLNLTRFTQEEVETIQFMKATFGDKVMDHVIAVFTGKDALDDDDDDNSMTIQQYIAKSPPFLRDFVSIECKGRYTAICNKRKNSGHKDDVQSVIDLIRKTITDNSNSYYTEKMFENAESVIQREIAKRRAVRENKNSYLEEAFKSELAIHEECEERRQHKRELTEDAIRDRIIQEERRKQKLEDDIREEVRTEIQEHNQESPPSEFWDSLESSAKAGISNLAAVVTLPVTLPLAAGRAIWNSFWK